MTTTMPTTTGSQTMAHALIERPPDTSSSVLERAEHRSTCAIGDDRQDLENCAPSSGRLVVVGYSGSAASLAALAWAAVSLAENDRILVVHATRTPITVSNGPSAMIADQLGRPEWATVRMTVDRLIGRERADTMVEHGNPADVLARHGAVADLVVLGRRRRGSRLFRRLLDEIPCAVVGIRTDGRRTQSETIGLLPARSASC